MALELSTMGTCMAARLLLLLLLLLDLPKKDIPLLMMFLMLKVGLEDPETGIGAL